MFTSKWQSNEGLWSSALTLVKDHHYSDAMEIVKVIAAQTVQTVGGKLFAPSLPTPKQKYIDEKEILYMKSLSRQIAEYVDKNDKQKATDLTTEYISYFVRFLADTKQEEDELHRTFLKSFIESYTDSKVIVVKSPSRQIKVKKTSKPYVWSMRTQTTLIHDKDSETEVYTSSEAAEIGGVSDQTIRRWCEKGKFPEAYQTAGGHWRVPKKYFKVSSAESKRLDTVMKKLDENTERQLGGQIDEFDLDIEYS